ncbi:putative metalloprotease CJM1_0395 family protein [Thiomicrorhabdus cannonii]|uniref:putative metalloprotease CJM1_0395 family protein n=1 Tax=Thiomicrorhabdus cannonii TaxID=2748011 RepID=UPI0015BA18F3|nr:putative metalloprotease CJM1_0395 family protein [Thiomicrorhabdus cannonii]
MLSIASSLPTVHLPTAVQPAGRDAVSLETQAARPVIIPAQGKPAEVASTSTPQKPSQEAFQEASQDRQPSKQQAQQDDAQVQQVINQLKARDSEVKAHEMAHLAAAGGFATSGASFVYQTGPDGKRYAIGGEVGIDTSAVPGDPQATLQKAMIIQRAALAPAEPSSQDLKVAGLAMQMAAQARIEIAQQNRESAQTGQTTATENSAEQNGVQTQGALDGIDDGSDRSRSIAVNADSENALGVLQAARSQFDLRLNLQG